MNIDKDDLDPRTAYELLGLSPGATLAEIRSAYLALVRLHHPDKSASRASKIQPVSGDDDAPNPARLDDVLDANASASAQGVQAQERGGRRDEEEEGLIVKLNEAYATLSSPESRAAYDAHLLASSTSSPSQHNKQDPSSSWSNGERDTPGDQRRTTTTNTAPPRISATVELDDFDVVHLDEVDARFATAVEAAAGRASQAARRAVDELYGEPGDNDGGAEVDDGAPSTSRSSPASAPAGTGGGAQPVFTYPCRCGHLFVVHPDELLTEAIISDASDGVVGLDLDLDGARTRDGKHEDPEKGAEVDARPPNLSLQDKRRRGSSVSSRLVEEAMSVLATCSGCSQVIKVTWGHHGDDEEDDGSEDGAG